MADGRRKDVLQFGTFILALLALVVPWFAQTLPRPAVWLSQASVLVFVAYWVGPPVYSRLRTWRLLRARRAALTGQWPAFQARVATFREFFTPAHARSADTLMQRMDTPPAAFNQHVVQQAKSVLALMDRLTANIARDAAGAPTLSESKRIARDLEGLFGVLEFQGVADTIRKNMAPRAGYELAPEEFFTAYDHFRRSYREFAREANKQVGEDIFDGH